MGSSVGKPTGHASTALSKCGKVTSSPDCSGLTRVTEQQQSIVPALRRGDLLLRALQRAYGYEGNILWNELKTYIALGYAIVLPVLTNIQSRYALFLIP